MGIYPSWRCRWVFYVFFLFSFFLFSFPFWTQVVFYASYRHTHMSILGYELLICQYFVSLGLFHSGLHSRLPLIVVSFRALVKVLY